MHRTAKNMSDERWFSAVGWFWQAIIAGIFVLGAIQTVSDEPFVVHSWNGLLTAVLILADAWWFLYMMRLRAARRLRRSSTLDLRGAHNLVGLGVALTVSLVLLHGEFVALTFADIGLIAFAIDGWTGIIPVALLGFLFLHTVGVPGSATRSATAANLLSLVSTVAIVYTLAAVIKQRVQRDRLIGELREAHAQLQEAHQELRVSHAREIELAALRERNRLAREMHDSLGHALVLIAIKIEAAQRLQPVDPGRAAAEWEETKALARSTMADLRTSLAGLRPPALADQPFSVALLELGAELERAAHVAVTIAAPREMDLLVRPVHDALYRVVQEALANVAKHAMAQHVQVRLKLQDHLVRLEVVDDGIGLAAAPRPEGGHYGITGMRERVEALGGTLTVAPLSESGQPVSNSGQPVSNSGQPVSSSKQPVSSSKQPVSDGDQSVSDSPRPPSGGGTVVHATIPVKEQIGAGHPHPAG